MNMTRRMALFLLASLDVPRKSSGQPVSRGTVAFYYSSTVARERPSRLFARRDTMNRSGGQAHLSGFSPKTLLGTGASPSERLSPASAIMGSPPRVR